LHGGGGRGECLEENNAEAPCRAFPFSQSAKAANPVVLASGDQPRMMRLGRTESQFFGPMTDSANRSGWPAAGGDAKPDLPSQSPKEMNEGYSSNALSSS
jgi:hypothetical protein